MSLKCGIVGLPNVGKSTLFNVLTKTLCAESSNYPFTTINPNVGFASVHDNRLDKLFSIAGSMNKVPTAIKFVDIAGLVRGASKGEGLGNQFLDNIRNVDAIIQVVRCFDDVNLHDACLNLLNSVSNIVLSTVFASSSRAHIIRTLDEVPLSKVTFFFISITLSSKLASVLI